MRVKEVMAPHMETATPGLSIRECAQMMKRLKVGSLPIQENDKLIGMITDRDICCRAVSDGFDLDTMKAIDIMTKDVVCCHADDDCTEAAHLMEERHIRRLAVLDKSEKMAGMLSVDDLAHLSPNLAGEVIAAAGPWVH